MYTAIADFPFKHQVKSPPKSVSMCQCCIVLFFCLSFPTLSLPSLSVKELAMFVTHSLLLFPCQGGHNMFGSSGGGMPPSRHQPGVPPINPSAGIRAQVPHQFLSPQVPLCKSVLYAQTSAQNNRFLVRWLLSKFFL